MRQKELALLKVELANNQAMFHKSTQDSEVATKISFQISLLIAKRCKQFADGDFIKDCCEIASQKICTETASKFDKIQLSRMTVQGRISAMSANITSFMKIKFILTFSYYFFM